MAPLSRGLLLAAASTIRERWRPAPAPEWVTSVPSARGPFVRDFAIALAAELRLPYVETLATAGGERQSLMENSVQQLTNVAGKLARAAAEVPAGPVLLVDDVVDSGWTLTWAGSLLREAGAGTIHPFTLAELGGGE
jgi:ATP-dependent DNA helicase RecQ